MLLGLLLIGSALGGVAAALWIASGGGLLSALFVYSAVATSVILGIAAVSFWASERRREIERGRAEIESTCAEAALGQ